MSAKDFVITWGNILKQYVGEAKEAWIPDGVTKIADKAFDQCTHIEIVHIPESVTDIGRCAFRHCENLREVNLPSQLKKLKLSVFKTCRSLQRIVLPAGLEIIEGSVFSQCESLKEIHIPSSVQEIGSNAFFGCECAVSVTIPATYLPKLESVFFSSNASVLTLTDVFDGEIDKNHFECFGKLEKIIAPMIMLSTVKGNTKKLFLNGFCMDPLPYVKDVRAAYVKYINGQKKKLLLRAVDEDDVVVFNVCEKIGIVIPPALRDELIGQAVEQKKMNTLSWLLDYKNRTADLKKEARVREQTDEQQFAAPYMAKFLKADWSWSRLENGTMRIDRYRGTDTTVNIPPYVGDVPVTCVGAHVLNKKKAYYNYDANTLVTRVVIPEGVTELEEHVFEDCTALTSVILPDSMTQIPAYAFKNCEKLSEIVIRENVTCIGSHAFDHCKSLQKVVIPKCVTDIKVAAFTACTSLNSVVMHEGITHIHSYAFEGCTDLENIIIPSTVQVIGRDAFNDTPWLKKAGKPVT